MRMLQKNTNQDHVKNKAIKGKKHSVDKAIQTLAKFGFTYKFQKVWAYLSFQILRLGKTWKIDTEIGEQKHIARIENE